MLAICPSGMRTDTGGKSMWAGCQKRNQVRWKMPPLAGAGRCWYCPA
jgi:hypothetical protein